MSQTNLPETSSEKGLIGLYYCRTASGLQQAELAQMAGISMGHLSRIETGTIDCRIDVCNRLAEALGVTPNDLIQKPTKMRICEIKINALQNKLNQERERLAILRVHGEDDEEAAA